MKKVVGIAGICLALVITASLGCGRHEDAGDMDTKVGFSALTALADSHITSYATSLEALSMTQEVQSGDWEEMVGLLNKVERAQVAGVVFFALPDGSYFTIDLGKTDKNLSDRSYFPSLMAGKAVLGDLVIGKTTGKKMLIAAVPVTKEGKVIGGVGAGIFLEDLSETLSEELELSDDMMFCAINDGDVVALHSDRELILGGEPELPKNVEFKTSPLTGWRFALGFKDWEITVGTAACSKDQSAGTSNFVSGILSWGQVRGTRYYQPCPSQV